MKPVYILSIFLIFIIGSSTCSFSKINLKQIPSIKANRLLEGSDETDVSDGFVGNASEYFDPDKKSSGLSAGSICAIAIPCIAALVGVGAAAAILGGGASAAATGPVLAAVTPSLPPPTYVDTTAAQMIVPQEIPVQPVQPQIIQPVEVPPQPIQQVIQPIPKVETPVVNIPQQPVVAQPQLVPVQQMQLVPVQQVEMVPVQQIEMVPVQEVVPTYQAAAEVIPQIPQVTQISGTQISQSIGQGIEQGVQQFGIQGGEFITAPEGYGTSVIQGSSNPLNLGEFSSQNLM